MSPAKYQYWMDRLKAGPVSSDVKGWPKVLLHYLIPFTGSRISGRELVQRLHPRYYTDFLFYCRDDLWCVYYCFHHMTFEQVPANLHETYKLWAIETTLSE